MAVIRKPTGNDQEIFAGTNFGPLWLSRIWTAPGVSLPLVRLGRVNADRVGTGAVVASIGLASVVFHAARQARQLPIQDGSHHMAAVANLAAELRLEGPGAFLRFAIEDTPDFLTYALMSLPTLLLGNGEVPFAIIWLACFGILAWALWTAAGSAPDVVRSLPVALVAFTGLFQSDRGGAWDTRIDLLAVTLSCASLLMLVQRRVFVAVLLAILACFAKGAAVALLIPLFGLALILGYFPLRELLRDPFRRIIQLLVAVAGIWLFASRVGPQAVSYNLMGTGATTAQGRVQAFIDNAARYLVGDWSFYVSDLVHEYRGWIWLLPLVLLPIGAYRRWAKSDLILGIFGLLAWVYAWALLSVAPIHSNVLTIWLLPPLTLLAAFVARAASHLVRSRVALGAAGVILALFGLTAQPLQPAPLDATYAPSVSTVLAESRTLAAAIDQRFSNAGTDRNVVFLVNFLSQDGPLVHNYDAYRVVVQEDLGRSSYVIDGWELGTFSQDWRPEFESQTTGRYTVFILQEHPAAVPWDNAPQRAGKMVWKDVQRIKAAHPECFTRLAPAVMLPKVGREEVLGLTETQACRQALLQAPGHQ